MLHFEEPTMIGIRPTLVSASSRTRSSSSSPPSTMRISMKTGAA